MSCLASKVECGYGNSVISGFQCEGCPGSTPYTTPAHDNCVSKMNCGNGSFANSQTASCEVCGTGSYSSPDFSTCASPCPVGSTLNLAENSCFCIPPTSYLNLLTGSCVNPSGCPGGYWANPSTLLCERCTSPTHFSSVLHYTCVEP